MTSYSRCGKSVEDNLKSGGHVPLPIQSFLLTQTNSFYLNKNSRENVSVSLERVLVQNIVSDLSPSICLAIQGVGRWQLIKTSFPHVMHCASLLMQEKFGDDSYTKTPFTITDTKTMYTLHWIIMDAAVECEDNDRENKCSEGVTYLHDLSAIQLFVYLFAPLVQLIDETLFQTLKLENGLNIWTALKNYNQPDLACFSAAVRWKTKKNDSTQKQTHTISSKTAQIYVGKGTSMEKLTFDNNDRTSFVNTAFCPIDILAPEESIESDMTTSFGGTSLLDTNCKNHWRKSAIYGGDMGTIPAPLPLSKLSCAPLARLSDICPLSTVSGETLNLEVYCDNCNSVVSNKSGELIGCSCYPITNVAPANKRNSWSLLHPKFGKLNLPIDWDYKTKIIHEAASCNQQTSMQDDDFLLATHLDVAVLRCLFSPKWAEPGVYWALRYLHKRLLEISMEVKISEDQEKRLQTSSRRRSKSCPSIKAEIPDYYWQEPFENVDSIDSNLISWDASNTASTSRFLIAQDPCSDLSASFPTSIWDRSMSVSTTSVRPSKKIKMTDLKERFNKISKLKKIEGGDNDGESQDTLCRLRNQIIHGMKPPSSPRQLRNIRPQDESMIPEELYDSASDKDERRNSLPSDKLQSKTSQLSTEVEALIPSKKSRKTVHQKRMNGAKARNIPSKLKQSRFCDINGCHENPAIQPEIQINTGYDTLESQPFLNLPDDPATALDPLPDSLNDTSAFFEFPSSSDIPSNSKKLAIFFEESPKVERNPESQNLRIFDQIKKVELTRWASDTEINYNLIEEYEQVPGSINYIQQNGQMDYNVVLKALHCVLGSQSTLRMCEYVMHNMACLFDIGIFEKRVRIKKVPNDLDNKDVFNRYKSRLKQKKSNRSVQSPSVPSAEENQRYSVGSSQQIGVNSSVGRRDRRISMMISQSSYITTKEYSDEETSEDPKPKSIPTRPSKIDKPVKDGGDKMKKSNSEERGIGSFSNNDIAMEITLRIIRILGCCHENQCQSQSREKKIGPPCGDPTTTRLQTHDCLLKLYKIHIKKFQNYLLRMTKEQALVDIVEFLHAYTGFCNDISLKQTGINSRNGYKNCFNQRISGEGTRGSEGVLIANMLEPFIERLILSRKELICQENISLYSDIRQLLIYFKEVHGNTFRRVLLTGMMNIWKKKKTKGSKGGRVQIIDPNTVRSGQSIACDSEYIHGRSSSDLHKRTSSLSAALVASELLQQIAANNQSSKSGRRNIFKRGLHNTSNENSGLPPHVPLYRRGKKRESLSSQVVDTRYTEDTTNDTVFDSITVLDSRSRARSIVADVDNDVDNIPINGGEYNLNDSSSKSRDKIHKLKERQRDPCNEGSLTASDTNLPKQKERKFIDPCILKKGMSIFAFMLDSFDPGIIPEPQLVASILDLDAPVLARACILLECANFVTRCNRGEWPSWMRFNVPGSFRHSSAAPMSNMHNMTGTSVCGIGGLKQTFPSQFINCANKKSGLIYRQAGRMFYSWAEAIGTRLEYFLRIEQAADRFSNISDILDDNKKRELQMIDEEENFLDDSTVNPKGDSCPYALKSVAVQLLLAITTYLRETHQFLPRYRNTSSNKDTFYERSSHLDIGHDQIRMTSDIINKTSPPYQSYELNSPVSDDQDSIESTIGDMGRISTENHPPGANRRISFAFIPERSLSLHSSNNSLNDPGEASAYKDRKVSRSTGPDGHTSSSQINTSMSASFLSPIRKISETLERRKSIGGKNLLRRRRGSGSMQRTNTIMRSVKEQPGTTRGSSVPAHTRVGSVKGRKESTFSQLSTTGTSFNLNINSSNSGSKDNSSYSDEPSYSHFPLLGPLRLVDQDTCATHMPWIKVVTQFANKTNFVCNHVDFCHPDCYERQQRQCRRLLEAVKTIYSCDLSRKRKREGKSSLAAGAISDDGNSSEESGYDGPCSVSVVGGGSLAAALSHSAGERGSCDTDIDASMQLLLHRAVSDNDEKKTSLFSRSKRKESNLGNHSPNRRRDSVPLFDKILKFRNAGNTNSDDLGMSLNLGEKGDPSLNKQRSTFKERVVDHPMLRFLDNHVYNLTHNCFNIINKGALLLTEELFTDIMPVAWELLLENDPELSASAANVVILAAIKTPTMVQQLIFRELQHEDVNQRIAALLRFRSLWSYRFQFWQRLEESASSQLKLPPPYIEFVLPSPTLGHPGGDVPDPSWSIRKGQSAEEVQLKQNEATKTFVTASTTRRKQQQEMLERAVTAEEQRRKYARQEFHLTTCGVLEKASYEVAFNKEHKDEFGLDDEDDSGSCLTAPPIPNQPLQYAQCVFPSSLCAATIPIIHLLDDVDVNTDGVSVSTIAEHVVWQCLVEDTTLFLRYLLERLTRVSDNDELLFVLRKLIQRLPELPTQSAHALFNNLVGYIMFYVRTPSLAAPHSNAGALSLLWQVVRFVQNIYFKDLKQILRKEQVDPTLMVTANLPCAKQFNVFDEDVFVAQLVRLQDESKDYRFAEILKEALQDSNIPEKDHHLYYLCDDRSNIIRNSNHYVRDFYFFKRNHTPKLRLKKLSPDDGQTLLQKNSFNLKFLEIGKVMFSVSILKYTPHNQNNNHVYFLHEELTKLPSFPRKALESEFFLYDTGSLGKQLLGMDMLHKISWCRLISLLFERMPSSFPWSTDIHLFLNILNGVLILHSEDTAMLRMCLAGFIQASQHFKMIFSVNGYMAIMPTILRVYSKNLYNPILKNAIHFVCKQFYILHRIPFILQMFGSISNFIDFHGDDINFYKVKPHILYDILYAITGDLEDNLDILQLLNCSKPLKALDFCYENDSDTWSILEAVTLCVTVIVYAPDSCRAKQMMIILQAILPFILGDLHDICVSCESSNVVETIKKVEAQAIQQLSISIKQLICTCDYLTRQYDKPFGKTGEEKCSFRVGAHLSQTQNSVVLDEQYDSPYRLLEEGRFRKNTVTSNVDDPSVVNSSRHSVIAPHEAILQVTCDFYTACHKRLAELGEKHKTVELLDQKSILRLSELAQSIIKQIPNDILLLRSKALQRFFLEIPPFVDWDHESMKSCKALENLIYRLNRTLNKILKENLARRNLDWDSLTNLIKGVFLIIKRNKSVAHMKDVRQLMDYLKKLILLDSNPNVMNESLSSVQFSGRHEQTSPNHVTNVAGDNAFFAQHNLYGIPPKFSSMVIKFFALMLQSLESSYKLKDFCERFDQRFGNTEAILVSYLSNIIIPLLLRCGGGRKESIQMSDENVYFIFDIILSSLNPIIHAGYQVTRITSPTPGNSGFQSTINKNYLGPGTQSSAKFLNTNNNNVTGEYVGGLASFVGINSFSNKNYQHLNLVDTNQVRSSSVSQSEKSVKGGNDYLYRLAFLALKVIMICYPRHSLIQSRAISSVITDLGLKKQGGIHLWKFLDFIVTKRMPIYISLIPFLRYKVSGDTGFFNRLNHFQNTRRKNPAPQIKSETQGEQALQQIISQKFAGLHLPTPRGEATILKELAYDLRQIKDELSGYLSQSQLSPVTIIGDIGHKSSSIRQIIPSFTNESLTNSSICNQSVQGSVGFINVKESGRTTYLVRSAISRNVAKRISSTEGGNIICRYQQVQNPHRSDAILTVSSVDSLPSQVTVEDETAIKRHGTKLQRSDTRGKKSVKLNWKQRAGSMMVGKQAANKNVSLGKPLEKHQIITGMTTPVGSAMAAAQAAQLYGSAAPYLRESLTKTRPEELFEMKGVAANVEDGTESMTSDASSLNRARLMNRSRSEETEETTLSQRDSLIPALDPRHHKIVIIEPSVGYSGDQGNSEEALLAVCGTGAALAESESSNTSISEFSSLLRVKYTSS